MVTPVVYRILAVPHYVDGDTLWVQRERAIGDAEGMEVITRDYLGGRKVRMHDGLNGLNTPEVNKAATRAAGMRAKEDLEALVSRWMSLGPCELITFGNDSFGRLLGDIRSPGDTVGVVQYMLDLGWESYK